MSSDLRFGGGPATDDELVVLDGVIAAGDPPDRLLPALWALQDHVGWISRAALDEVGRRLGVAPAVAYGVASFYDLFALEPAPPAVARACGGIACRLAGADASADAPCLGLCDLAPAALVDGIAVGSAEPAVVAAVLRHRGIERERLGTAGGGAVPPVGPPPLPANVAALGPPRLLARVLRVVQGDEDALDAELFLLSGGQAALDQAQALGLEGLLARFEEAGLAGRGGAAFPAAVKWRAVAGAADPVRYLVANADESEPGTFKDRVLLEHDPLLVLTGVVLASRLLGVTHAVVYVRGEYAHAHHRLAAAVDRLAALGVLDGLTIELRRGAGAYICGEETALLESIEGRRGEPRLRPPYPAEHGLFGHPTVVHNVETLAAVALLARDGVAAGGTKLLSVSGDVERPGVFEVPWGTPLRTVIDELAGGVRGAADGRRIQAVLCGGAAGTFLAPDQLDLPVDVAALRAAGAELGSGSLVVLDDTRDLRDEALGLARFFAHESCGQCTPCREGTVRQVELLAAPRLDAGALDDVARVLRDASICGLGQAAAGAVASAVRLTGGA